MTTLPTAYQTNPDRRTLGLLIARLEGELAAGDEIVVEPTAPGLGPVSPGFSGHRLCLSVTPELDQVENGGLKVDLRGHVALLRLEKLWRLPPEAAGQWVPPVRWVITYHSAVGAGQVIDFTISLLIDYNLRTESHFLGVKPDYTPKAIQPAQQSPWYRLDWWANPRESQEFGELLPTIKKAESTEGEEVDPSIFDWTEADTERVMKWDNPDNS